MPEYILKLVIAVVAAAMILCSQSVTCDDRRIKDHQFPSDYRFDRSVVFTLNYDNQNLGICKSADDEDKAKQACENLSAEYTGKCENILLQFADSHYQVYDTRLTAICYTPAGETVGCLTNKPNDVFEGRFVYWQVVLGEIPFFGKHNLEYYCKQIRNVF